jgi:hypothetical protein
MTDKIKEATKLPVNLNGGEVPAPKEKKKRTPRGEVDRTEIITKHFAKLSLQQRGELLSKLQVITGEEKQREIEAAEKRLAELKGL